ncbi:probable E3 ubiquitin-protein ligase ARI1 isoform X2 [Phoenix dactylifera]|uniref:RBR-type E3 ubiquitin transferase n=1 Tax=Phoenix dactylifera TaxID=42345 RepID=A0A8B8ZFQ5_PHODC|nr:probable E3 ubiquitin-protein ligase ARI1 isoform X2 [Phoenix dactylifera]
MADDDYGKSSSDVEEYSSEEDDAVEESILDRLEEKPQEDEKRSFSSIITRESLLAAQKEDLQKVMDFLAVSEQHARTLLIHNRWNVERVFELLERKERERLLCEAGVLIAENEGLDLWKSSSAITCNICFEDVAPNAATAMGCGHCYCNDCWTEHFIVKINDGQSRRIRCMAPKCKAICDEAIIRNLVSEKYPDIADRFNCFLLESYIEDNDMIKWCPSIPHCGNAIRVEGDIYCEVECSCGLNFCFNCLLEAHSPCSCLMWELWIKKCNDDLENINWFRANTKHCPKCYKPVEKDGGCNLVTCVCGQHFCWLCGGATGFRHSWNRIADHSCDGFKEEKNENRLMETIKESMRLLENKQSGIKNFSWVLNGLHILLGSRRFLSHSYPFAFYMFGDELFKDEISLQEREIKQDLFEDQQQQLESYVDILSIFLDNEFHKLTDEELINTRARIINLSQIVDNLCKEMYKCIENKLLYPLKCPVSIAPYNSAGLKGASELSKQDSTIDGASDKRSSTNSSYIR